MMNFLLPAFGGILIGLSATLLLLMTGRIAGISGIVWESLTSTGGEKTWRLIFLVGLLLGTWVFHATSGQPYPEINNNYILAVLGGALVGLGVKIGSGCTSGHGVCGIGRLSKRSILATATFMGAGIATVSVVGIILGKGGLA